MPAKQLQLIYALKNGKAIHISEVESGLKCGCVCPACGEPLVAKKGNKNLHHFAHKSGQNCEHGYETSLHLAAKEILSETKKIVIPEVFLTFPNSYKKREKISDPKEISIDEVKLEQRYDDIIPDVVVISGGKELFVEIFVTHKIDDIKLEKLKEKKISTIEVDLSKQKKTITKEELSQILLGDNDLKTWKYNDFAQRQLIRLYEISDKRNYNEYGVVNNCPIRSLKWKETPCLNISSCVYCKYCIYLNERTRSILCSGRLRISSLQDFDIPIEKRIKDSNAQLDEQRKSYIRKGYCPNCSCGLVERQRPYGVFLGCARKCGFEIVIDSKTGEIKNKSLKGEYLW